MSARLVTLSGENSPEQLGAVGTVIAAVVSAVVAVATTVVSAVQSSRASDAFATQQQVQAKVQANQELAAMQAALQNRNATIQSGYSELLTKAANSQQIKGLIPAAVIGVALVGGVVAMRRKNG